MTGQIAGQNSSEHPAARNFPGCSEDQVNNGEAGEKRDVIDVCSGDDEQQDHCRVLNVVHIAADMCARWIPGDIPEDSRDETCQQRRHRQGLGRPAKQEQTPNRKYTLLVVHGDLGHEQSHGDSDDQRHASRLNSQPHRGSERALAHPRECHAPDYDGKEVIEIADMGGKDAGSSEASAASLQTPRR